MPKSERIEGVLVLSPPELIARKVVSYHARRNQPKAGTDWRDLAMLLLAFPELKSEAGPVAEALKSLGAKRLVRDCARELDRLRPEGPEYDSPGQSEAAPWDE